MRDLIDTQIDEIVSSSIGFKLDRAEFVRGLQFANEFVSKDKSRPILCGVNLTVKKINDEIALRMTATDSYKLGGYFLKVADPMHLEDEPSNNEYPITDLNNPRHFLLEDPKSVLKILESRKDLERVALFITPSHNKIVVATIDDQPDLVTVCNLISGEFPNVDNLIPKEEDFKAELPNGINLGSDHLQKTINAFKKIKVATVVLRFQGNDLKPVFISPQSREGFEVEYPFGLLMPVRCS